MKIDSAIQVFSEKYDRDAIVSIEDISKERGLVLNRSTIKAFNINESFNKFSQYLREYTDYKVKNVDNDNASPQHAIRESASNFIEKEIIHEEDVKYSELPKFVKSYIEGVELLRETVDDSKQRMFEENIDQEAIGDINDFADKFMDKLHESFDPAMDKILLASGYTSRKKLFNRSNKSDNKPMFL